MNYELHPGTGINDLKFGMTREQVAELAGPAKRIITYGENMPILKERREGMDVAFLLNKAVEFMFFEDQQETYKGKVLLDDMSLFETDKLLLKMMELDKPEMCFNDRYVMCPNMGLLLGGFGETAIFEGKVIVLFDANRKNFWYNFMKDHPMRRMMRDQQKYEEWKKTHPDAE